MGHILRACLHLVVKKVKVNSFLLTIVSMLEISPITKLMDMVYTHGLMVDNTKVLGELTKCMVGEFSNGQMARNL